MTEDYFAGFSPEQRASLLRIFEIQEENFRRVELRAKERVVRAGVMLNQRISELQSRVTALEGALAAKGVVHLRELETFRQEIEAMGMLAGAVDSELAAEADRRGKEFSGWVATQPTATPAQPATTPTTLTPRHSVSGAGCGILPA